MLYDYFVAVDDTMAALAFDDPDNARCAGYAELVVKGADPITDLLPAETSLTRRTTAEVEADPGRGREVALLDEGEAAVLSLADSFRDALATADDTALQAAAAAFAEEQVEDVEAEHLVPFLKELAALAGGAAEEGHHLYCAISL
ncbi:MULTISPECIES: hypothetical protein [Amycolatopsis]|uniref:DUF1877 family protein n=1 Tax=Amycolatopsis dendrobii TaxID=2760662 RepID=A0A7W3W4S3_9PSEU|nr:MULTISPECIES: hypothetical protein [Amycolatopsis]MBB1158719.1 hypothetical protein [Amycolatopsis dendrobii]UKD50994.1 hypothetical protein L3Q65_23975 [Amycolatopsis sp. FU40]